MWTAEDQAPVLCFQDTNCQEEEEQDGDKFNKENETPKAPLLPTTSAPERVAPRRQGIALAPNPKNYVHRHGLLRRFPSSIRNFY